MSICELYAKIVAKRQGMTYAQAIKKFPRGPIKNSCYYNDLDYLEAHCVHCARTNAIMKMVR